MRKRCFFIALWSMVFLVACGEGEKHHTTTTSTPTIPWEISHKEKLSYDEFFSRVRPYERFSHEVGVLGETYIIGKTEAGWAIKHQHTGAILWDVEGSARFVWLTGNEERLYGVTNDGRLMEMDVFGKDQKELYADTGGFLSGDTVFLNGETLFFVTRSSNGYAVKRVYVPDGSIDTLFEQKQPIHLQSPISNVEIIWTTPNEAFDELYEQLKKDSANTSYDFENEEMAMGAIELDYRIRPWTEQYFNALTGEHKTIEKGIYYDPRTNENIEKNGYRWWLDE